ncbi:metallophosphoesterase [Streptomyces yaizuensis]|uniref:Metallophosphoesterase n=1 Tax=Streptomyces yaizuensis TaxID=2989713 RepID=A0ABQ5P524_9ACTN|nr:metallophosphoesterase [Streptomyces sp. YSPA8]GLF97693.1 metallophosphoesterase [Streptomyces sp. YSPA8]
MIAVVLLVMIAVIALLVGAHWYVWRRIVRDTTRGPGAARRIGTVAICVLPLLSVGAVLASRAGAPPWLERLLAWPGYYWLAILLYLVLALLVGEAVRAVWLRLGDRRAGDGTAETSPPPDARDAAAQADTAPVPQAPSFGNGSGTGTGAPAGTRISASTGTDTATDTETATVPQTDGTPVVAGADAATADASAAHEIKPAAGTPAVDTPAVDTPAAEAPAPAPAPAPESEPAPAALRAVSRRLFVSRVVGAGAVAATLGTVAHGTHTVLRGPRIKRVTVPLAKLPRSAHGLRIAVVSDIHIGPILGRSHTQRIVDVINSAQPDLIAVVGDMVDGTVAHLGSAAEPLAQLRARHGSFFVTGNHEYYSHAGEWIDHVRELGLKPLENERVEIAGGFDLAGVNDIQGESIGHGPDFGKALGDRDRSRASVLLAHQPVVIHDAVEHGVDLQLSGHTHGGQLWPGNFVAELSNPTVAGLERYGDTQLYVTQGAGAWGPPVRVGTESEVTIVQLASRQA